MWENKQFFNKFSFFCLTSQLPFKTTSTKAFFRSSVKKNLATSLRDTSAKHSSAHVYIYLVHKSKKHKFNSTI